MNILVTGAAGFIGWKVCEFLLTRPELLRSACPVRNVVSNGVIASVAKQSKSVSPLHPSSSAPLLDSNAVTVVGLDNLNDYYDVRLKHWRLDQLKQLSRHCEESSDEAISGNRFIFHKLDIEDYSELKKLFQQYSATPVIAPVRLRRKRSEARQSQNSSVRTLHSSPKDSIPAPRASFQRDSANNRPPFQAVINLAARAGVRYSMENPWVYYTTNVLGNLNLLELCREFGVNKYVFASTSSLYAGQKMPFKEDLPVNEPISPYAASKKGAEVTCYTYHKLYDIDTTILRYFTVYGPAGRPDMSIFRFIYWIDKGKEIEVFGDGTQSRDFTYVDDIARGTIAALRPLGFEIINLGGNNPHKLIDVLELINDMFNQRSKPSSVIAPVRLRRKRSEARQSPPVIASGAKQSRLSKPSIIYKPFHPTDMSATWADIAKAKRLLKWNPKIPIEQGIEETIKWYIDNYNFASNTNLP